MELAENMKAREDSKAAMSPSVANAVAPALAAGEHVVVAADCLRRLHLQLFEKATVVATNQRLMIVAPTFPWGHTVRATFPLGDCSVINGKERFDGSRLLVIQHATGTLCLYFSGHHRQEADWIVESVGLTEDPAVKPTVDTQALNMELQALAAPPEEDDF